MSFVTGKRASTGKPLFESVLRIAETKCDGIGVYAGKMNCFTSGGDAYGTQGASR